IEVGKESTGATWTDLPVKQEGATVTYEVTEVPVSGYDAPSYAPANIEATQTGHSGTITVKNVHTPEVTQVSVTKVWDDNDDQDGLRKTVTVTLSGKYTVNGSEKSVTIPNATKTIEVGRESIGATWTDLPVKQEGATVTYEVTEVPVSGYNAPSYAPANIEATQTEHSGTITVTNKHIPEETEVKVFKVWDDADDQDGYRPDDVTVNLLADGSIIDTVTLSEENEWSYSWTKLDKKAKGADIDYTVTENAVSEYTTKIVKNDENSFSYTVTNSHTPEKTEYTVTKVWDDLNDIGEIRPAAIQVQLTADGEKSGDPVTLNDTNNWTYTWTDLDKYKDHGTEIVYHADETAVPAGYEKEISATKTGALITNTYEPKPVDVNPPVQKIIEGPDEDLYNMGDFTFTIAGAKEGVTVPLPENTSITNSPDYELEDKKGFYEFGVITFTLPGTYEYKVTESGSVPNVQNDPEAETGKTLTFTVKDDGTGKLVVSPTSEEVQLSFTNILQGLVSEQFGGKKNLKHFSSRPLPTFTFQLFEIVDGEEELIDTATTKGSGRYTFRKIQYYKTGTYEYVVREMDGGYPGITYDTREYRFTVEVYENENGTYGTRITGDNAKRLNFVNDSETPPPPPHLPDTGFSAVHAQTLPEQPKDVNYKTLRWRLEIPTLDMSTDIVEVPLVDNEYPVTWLGYSAGLLEDSALPGQGRSLITGHNHLNTMEAGPFALLDTLNEGDRIFVTDPASGLQIFEVYMNTKISEYDFDGLTEISETDEHSLTLITCEDERVEGGYANRRIIAARPIG
ncbi:MAG: Cna B-type domain-containing protein, partial [Flexilinea sp.]|nr:Cna B-type domain-containing protein [Flexilinea sp.]